MGKICCHTTKNIRNGKVFLSANMNYHLSIRCNTFVSYGILNYLTICQYTVDVERFVGLNIHGISPMKFFVEILSRRIGH